MLKTELDLELSASTCRPMIKTIGRQLQILNLVWIYNCRPTVIIVKIELSFEVRNCRPTIATIGRQL